MLKEELQVKIDKECFWTDSQVVLAYIHNEAQRFHVFMQIEFNLSEKKWIQITVIMLTKQNSADLPSRGLCVADIP